LSKDTALLVVDVQTRVVDWSQATSQGSEEVLARINALMARARAAKAPVIYVQHDGDVGGRLAPGSEGWQIHPSIAPASGETVIRKQASDSFYETSLEDELKARGIRHLVIVGCRTQYCVDATCRSAVSRNYDVTLVKDAHMTIDTETLKASQIIAHHNETLDDFGNNNHVVTVKECAAIDFR
jgi:nicotinamidase-related amidase